GQVVNYADFSKVPVERVSKYYLARWAQLYYGRNHATLHRDFAESLNFFSNELQSATLARVTKAKALETFLLDPSAPNVDIEIKAVVLDDTRQAPYRAHIEFEKVFYSPGDQQEQSRERWTANVIYAFRDEVPNQMLLTNPLGLVISYVHEDQAFGNWPMLANAVFVATLIFLALGFWLMQELHFLAPWRSLIMHNYLGSIAAYCALLF